MGYSPDQMKAMIDFINAKAEFYRKVTPKYLKLNKNYLNELIFNEHVEQVEFSSDNGMSIDYKGIVPFHGIPVVIDNTIKNFEFVYENGEK